VHSLPAALASVRLRLMVRPAHPIIGRVAKSYRTAPLN